MSEEVGRSWKMFQLERTVFVRPWAKTKMVFSENQKVIWHMRAQSFIEMKWENLNSKQLSNVLKVT